MGTPMTSMTSMATNEEEPPSLSRPKAGSSAVINPPKTMPRISDPMMSSKKRTKPKCIAFQSGPRRESYSLPFLLPHSQASSSAASAAGSPRSTKFVRRPAMTAVTTAANGRKRAITGPSRP